MMEVYSKMHSASSHTGVVHNHFVAGGILDVKFQSLGFNQSLINRFLVNTPGFGIKVLK